MLEIKSRHLTWGGPRWRATECQSYMVSITKARECASIFHLAKDVVIQKIVNYQIDHQRLMVFNVWDDL